MLRGFFQGAPVASRSGRRQAVYNPATDAIVIKGENYFALTNTCAAVALGISRTGIDFQAIDGRPTRVFDEFYRTLDEAPAWGASALKMF